MANPLRLQRNHKSDIKVNRATRNELEKWIRTNFSTIFPSNIIPIFAKELIQKRGKGGYKSSEDFIKRMSGKIHQVKNDQLLLISGHFDFTHKISMWRQKLCLLPALLIVKVVEKSGHPDFPPVRSHRAQLRQWAQDRVVHFSEREAILFTYVTAIH